MKYVIGVAEEMLCGGAGERRELIPVFKRMYEEMNAATNRGVPELKWLNAMQYMIDDLEMGPIKALDALNARKAAWGLK